MRVLIAALNAAIATALQPLPDMSEIFQSAGNPLCFPNNERTQGLDSYQACCLHEDPPESCWWSGRNYKSCCFSGAVHWRRLGHKALVVINDLLLMEMISAGEVKSDYSDFAVGKQEDGGLENSWQGNSSARLKALRMKFDPHNHPCRKDDYRAFVSIGGHYGPEKHTEAIAEQIEGGILHWNERRMYCVPRDLPLQKFAAEIVPTEFYSELFRSSGMAGGMGRKNRRVLIHVMAKIAARPVLGENDVDVDAPAINARWNDNIAMGNLWEDDELAFGSVGKLYAPPNAAAHREYIDLYKACGECELVLEGPPHDGGYVMCAGNAQNIRSSLHVANINMTGHCKLPHTQFCFCTNCLQKTY